MGKLSLSYFLQSPEIVSNNLKTKRIQVTQINKKIEEKKSEISKIDQKLEYLLEQQKAAIVLGKLKYGYNYFSSWIFIYGLIILTLLWPSFLRLSYMEKAKEVQARKEKLTEYRKILGTSQQKNYFDSPTPSESAYRSRFPPLNRRKWKPSIINFSF